VVDMIIIHQNEMMMAPLSFSYEKEGSQHAAITSSIGNPASLHCGGNFVGLLENTTPVDVIVSMHTYDFAD
jgi:hypothetical protein